MSLLKKLREEFDFTREEQREIGLQQGKDFYFEDGSGREFRFIHEDAIEAIYFDETVETIKECYNLDVPDFIEIDWKATVENCLQDGYGHHFSHYDGSEVYIDGWYIFRTS